LQAAIIGAYGNDRRNGSPATRSNRILHFLTLYNINAELRVYHMIGFRWEGENQFGSGLRQQACGLRIIDGQSIAYGRFENLRFENGCGGKSGAALVDIDYNKSQGPDLSPQNITFYDDFFAGNGMTDVGCRRTDCEKWRWCSGRQHSLLQLLLQRLYRRRLAGRRQQHRTQRRPFLRL